MPSLHLALPSPLGSTGCLFVCIQEAVDTVYLLYVDESGDFSNPEAGHVVLGAVAVHEDDARQLAREVDAILARHLDPHLLHLELHAQHVRKGKGGWRGVPGAMKASILDDVANLLATFSASRAYGLFAVARRPGAVSHADPLERAYEELALRFNTFVRKSRVDGLVQHGMFICDEAKYEKIVQPLVQKWRQGDGTRFGRLTRIVEVPLFVDSAASRLIQLADFVAHASFLAYEERDDRLMNAISQAFQRRNGALHGLVHLTTESSTCVCLACVARRTHPTAAAPLT